MKPLLCLAAITRLTAASYLQNAGPRSAGGLLFRNTTQATLPASVESVSPTNVEITSSVAGGRPTIQPPTSKDPITSPIRPGSSSNPAMAPINPSDLATVQGSLSSSSIHAVESTHSDPLTVIQGSPSLTSNPAVGPTNYGDLTMVQGSSSSGSNLAAGPTASRDLTVVSQTIPSLRSNSIAELATSTDVTTALYRPSSIHPESVDKAGLASTATHKTEPSRAMSTLSTEPPTDPVKPSAIYSASPTTLSQSTSGALSSTYAPTLVSSLSHTAQSTAAQDVTSPLRKDRTSGSVDSSLPPLSAMTASLTTIASKPQTAMHAVAIDVNTTVEGSLLIATSPTPSRDGVRVNVGENLTAVGGTAASQTIQGSSTSRTSTANAVTLQSGGAIPTTILTEAPSPTRGHPSGQVQTPSQALPRVILPNSSSGPSAHGNLIQLGFLFPLNYVFVSQHLQAAAQIFEVLPGALAHGAVQRNVIEVAKLVPYDTQATVGYITTVAKLYYPKALVDQLQTNILDPKSDIYTKGEDVERNLTALIDPAIKITDDNGGTDCASPSCAASSLGTPSSSKQTGITAGAVVGGAAFCGVLGLGIFQLYRRHGSALAAAWPFGKQERGRLAKSQISRPIDSVNSLGWNWLTNR